jgi:hypothetical protein
MVQQRQNLRFTLEARHAIGIESKDFGQRFQVRRFGPAWYP